MTVEEGLRDTVARFVRGRLDIEELYDWLASHARALSNSPDQAARKLDGLAWLMFSEWSIGDRTEEQAREVLAEHVSDEITHALARAFQVASGPAPFESVFRFGDPDATTNGGIVVRIGATSDADHWRLPLDLETDGVFFGEPRVWPSAPALSVPG